MDELVAAGLLVREHGRGMFVAPEKITQELVSNERAMTAPQASGAWTSRLLEFTTVPAGARVGRRLRLSPAAEIVYVARLRLVDGAPMAIEHLHIRADLVPTLSAQELEAGDLYEHLREQHGVHVQEAVQAIEPTVVTRAEAELLDVPELSPALLFERLTTDTTGQPVEYVHSVYRGDRYRIVSRLTLGPALTAPSTPLGHPGIPRATSHTGTPLRLRLGGHSGGELRWQLRWEARRGKLIGPARRGAVNSPTRTGLTARRGVRTGRRTGHRAAPPAHASDPNCPPADARPGRCHRRRAGRSPRP